MGKEVKVAVGVVLKNNSATGVKETFVTRRLAHQHQGGKWEFPGGKVEQGETTEQALAKRDWKKKSVLMCNRLSP